MPATHWGDVKKRQQFDNVAIAVWRNPSHSVLPARRGPSALQPIPASVAAKPFVPKYKYVRPPEPTDDEASSIESDDEGDNGGDIDAGESTRAVENNSAAKDAAPAADEIESAAEGSLADTKTATTELAFTMDAVPDDRQEAVTTGKLSAMEAQTLLVKQDEDCSAASTVGISIQESEDAEKPGGHASDPVNHEPPLADNASETQKLQLGNCSYQDNAFQDPPMYTTPDGLAHTDQIHPDGSSQILDPITDAMLQQLLREPPPVFASAGDDVVLDSSSLPWDLPSPPDLGPADAMNTQDRKVSFAPGTPEPKSTARRKKAATGTRKKKRVPTAETEAHLDDIVAVIDVDEDVQVDPPAVGAAMEPAESVAVVVIAEGLVNAGEIIMKPSDPITPVTQTLVEAVEDSTSPTEAEEPCTAMKFSAIPTSPSAAAELVLIQKSESSKTSKSASKDSEKDSKKRKSKKTANGEELSLAGLGIETPAELTMVALMSLVDETDKVGEPRMEEQKASAELGDAGAAGGVEMADEIIEVPDSDNAVRSPQDGDLSAGDVVPGKAVAGGVDSYAIKHAENNIQAGTIESQVICIVETAGTQDATTPAVTPEDQIDKRGGPVYDASSLENIIVHDGTTNHSSEPRTGLGDIDQGDSDGDDRTDNDVSGDDLELIVMRGGMLEGAGDEGHSKGVKDPPADFDSARLETFVVAEIESGNSHPWDDEAPVAVDELLAERPESHEATGSASTDEDTADEGDNNTNITLVSVEKIVPSPAEVLQPVHANHSGTLDGDLQTEKEEPTDDAGEATEKAVVISENRGLPAPHEDVSEPGTIGAFDIELSEIKIDDLDAFEGGDRGKPPADDPISGKTPAYAIGDVDSRIMNSDTADGAEPLGGEDPIKAPAGLLDMSLTADTAPDVKIADSPVTEPQDSADAAEATGEEESGQQRASPVEPGQDQKQVTVVAVPPSEEQVATHVVEGCTDAPSIASAGAAVDAAATLTEASPSPTLSRGSKRRSDGWSRPVKKSLDAKPEEKLKTSSGLHKSQPGNSDYKAKHRPRRQSMTAEEGAERRRRREARKAEETARSKEAARRKEEEEEESRLRHEIRRAARKAAIKEAEEHGRRIAREEAEAEARKEARRRRERRDSAIGKVKESRQEARPMLRTSSEMPRSPGVRRGSTTSRSSPRALPNGAVKGSEPGSSSRSHRSKTSRDGDGQPLTTTNDATYPLPESPRSHRSRKRGEDDGDRAADKSRRNRRESERSERRPSLESKGKKSSLIGSLLRVFK